MGEVIYTAVRDSQGNYTVTPDDAHPNAPAYKAAQSGNNITNTETKAFEFTKIWKDMGNQTIPWPENLNIEITMNARTDESEKALADVKVTLDPLNLPQGWTVTTKDDKTTFHTTGLDAVTENGKELTYYVVESKINGYQDPSYAMQDGNPIVNRKEARNGEQIINRPEEAVSLPSTGGFGTRIFSILGSILILGAGVLLWRRRRTI